jgi:predicted permease
LFAATFTVTFHALFQVFLISFLAGVLVKKEIITQEQIKGLSTVTVQVLLPCLIFHKTVATFKPYEFELWWMMPLIAVIQLFLGLGLGYLCFWRSLPQKNNLLPMASMQNAAYLVLPIGQILYPGQFDLFATYCFLYVLGMSPFVWSIGKKLVTNGASTAGVPKEQSFYSGLITPPFVANIVAIVVVFSPLAKVFPPTILNAVALLGSATIPLAVFILGATLGTITLKGFPSLKDIAGVAAIKYLLLPLFTLVALVVTGFGQAFPLASNLIMIQAAAPPATALILMVKSYGGDVETFGSMLLLQYIFCLIALPVWLAIWNMTV